MTAPANYNDHDLDIASKTLWGEARGEPIEGQTAVAWVLRNRSERGAFAGKIATTPGAIAYVCQAPWQFSCWNSDDPNCAKMMVLKPAELAKQIDIVARALEGLDVDPTHGADHYYANSIAAPSWTRNMKQVARIGAHVFFNSQLPARPILVMGVRNPHVTAVQKALAAAGFYHGAASGIYDVDLYDAVRRYQATKHITIDGIVGDETYATLGMF